MLGAERVLRDVHVDDGAPVRVEDVLEVHGEIDTPAVQNSRAGWAKRKNKREGEKGEKGERARERREGKGREGKGKRKKGKREMEGRGKELETNRKGGKGVRDE